MLLPKAYRCETRPADQGKRGQDVGIQSIPTSSKGGHWHLFDAAVRGDLRRTRHRNGAQYWMRRIIAYRWPSGRCLRLTSITMQIGHGHSPASAFSPAIFTSSWNIGTRWAFSKGAMLPWAVLWSMSSRTAWSNGPAAATDISAPVIWSNLRVTFTALQFVMRLSSRSGITLLICGQLMRYISSRIFLGSMSTESRSSSSNLYASSLDATGHASIAPKAIRTIGNFTCSRNGSIIPGKEAESLSHLPMQG